MAKFCAQCGNKLVPDSKFCNICGAIIPVSAPANTYAGTQGNVQASNAYQGTPLNAQAPNIYQGAPANVQAPNTYQGAPANAQIPNTYQGTPANVQAQNAYPQTPRNVQTPSAYQGAPVNAQVPNAYQQTPRNVQTSDAYAGMRPAVAGAVNTAVNDMFKVRASGAAGEVVAGDFGGVAGLVGNIAGAVGNLTGAGKVNPIRIVLSCLAIVVLWIVQIILLRKGIENPFTKILNFLTFAKGNMSRGIAGYIGGTLGMGVVASAFVTLFGGGFKSITGGIKRMFSSGGSAQRSGGYNGSAAANGDAASKGSIGFAILGAIAAIILYFIYTGNMFISGTMAGVAGIIVCLRSIGSRGGGLYRFISGLTSKKINGIKSKSPAAAKSLLSGATTGFAIALMISGILSAAGLGNMSGSGDNDPMVSIPGQSSEEDDEDAGSETADEDEDDKDMTDEYDKVQAESDQTDNAEVGSDETDVSGTDSVDGDGDADKAASDKNSDAISQSRVNLTPANDAISGGTWDIMQSGEKIYTLSDGSYVMNVWVEDNGKYYYVDYSGCLMKNNYTPEGFWAGEDGSWYESVPQRTEDLEPEAGTDYGTDPVLRIDKTGDVSDGSYGKAIRSYSFGHSEEYNVISLGCGTYLLEGKDDFNSGLLMSVSDDRKTLTISGGGITESYTIGF